MLQTNVEEEDQHREHEKSRTERRRRTIGSDGAEAGKCVQNGLTLLLTTATSSGVPSDNRHVLPLSRVIRPRSFYIHFSLTQARHTQLLPLCDVRRPALADLDPASTVRLFRQVTRNL